MRRVTIVIAVFSLLLALALPVMAQDQTIVEIAAGNDDFSTLVAAVTAADLAETLSGDGPFTVFAPTNDAFETALDELGLTLDDVVGDIDLLTSILTYHVVAGEVFAADLSDGQRVATVNGATFVVNLDDGASITDSAGRSTNIVATDIDASNGVIHVIDSVILPPSQTIVDIAAGNDDFSTLVAAVMAAELAETLSGEGPFTVFAPTNEAFTSTLNELGLTLDDIAGDPDLLTSILTYHVINGSVYSSDLSDGLEAATINGATFTVNISDDGVTLSDGMSREITVVATDIEGTNGVIHVIDEVILPPMQEESASSDDMMGGSTIAEIVIAGSEGGDSDRDGFSYLLAAVQAADPSVLEALSSDGSLTVFAPNNQGFINLTAALGLTPKQLLSSQNEAILTQVLLYHVVPGEVRAADVVGLPNGSSVYTLLPDSQNAFAVYFDSAGNPYLNNGVNLVATDIEASNGVIHVINDVLVPQCVLQTLSGEGSCG